MNSTILEAQLGDDTAFSQISLGDGHSFFAGRLPDELVFTQQQFDELWDLHPTEYHLISIHGRIVRTPRWQQAYGADYHYYDGKLGHYIGKHRDSTRNMIQGAPIVTISLGQERNFRLRPWKGKGFRDFPATHGTVFIMPYETNLAWTHEVPHATKYRGRRISITARAFQNYPHSRPAKNPHVLNSTNAN